MNIKKSIALILTFLMLLSTFAGCRKINDNGSSSLSFNTNSDIAYSNVDIIENSSIESDLNSLLDDENNGSNAQSTDDGSSSQVGAETEDQTVEEPNKNINPYGIEIFGSGTKDDPYVDTPNVDTNILKTLIIPANSSVYYSVYRVVGKDITINNASAYIVYEGTKYAATGGKVNFVVKEPNQYLPNSPVLFEIGNTSSSPVSLDLIFADVEGSWELSESVNALQKNTTHFDASKEQSEIYYEYVATQSGTLHFYFTETIEATDNFTFYVQNNTGATVQKANDDDLTEADDDIYEVELSVNKGDHIKIFFTNNKKGRTFMETNIEWYAEYK